MRAADIANLTVLMGPVNPLFAQVFEGRASDDPPSLAECLQVTLSDFELGWNLASSFAAAARPLPDFVLSPSIVRAHQACLDPGCLDNDLATASELQMPQQRTVRDAIRGLLLCPEATDQSIGTALGVSPGVVRDFEALWWNVRDRRRDLLYMSQLLNSQDSALAQRQLKWGLRGKTEWILLAGDISNPTLSDEQLRAQMVEMLLTEALELQQQESMAKADNPALELVEKFLLNPDQPLEEVDILTALSFNKEAQQKFRAWHEAQTREKLEATRLWLEAEAARKAQSSTESQPT
jgi:hypothetical protein